MKRFINVIGGQKGMTKKKKKETERGPHLVAMFGESAHLDSVCIQRVFQDLYLVRSLRARSFDVSILYVILDVPGATETTLH